MTAVPAGSADATTWHAHTLLALVRVGRKSTRLTLAQREMNTLRCYLFAFRQIEQFPQRVFGALGLHASHAKVVPATADLHLEP